MFISCSGSYSSVIVRQLGGRFFKDRAFRKIL